MEYSKLFQKDKTWEFHVTKQYEDRDGGDNFLIRVEESENRNHFCEWRLPDISCQKSFGLSEDELFEIEDYLMHNESIIWDDWREYKASQIAPN